MSAVDPGGTIVASIWIGPRGMWLLSKPKAAVLSPTISRQI